MCFFMSSNYKCFINTLLFLICMGILFTSCSETEDEKVIVKFIVISNTMDTESPLCISGNRKELGDWDAAKIKLTKVADSIWTKEFTFNKGDFVEYKFTRGSWFSEALDSNRMIPENSVLKVQNDTTIYIKVDYWRISKVDGHILITKNLLEEYSGTIELISDWRINYNDSLAFSLLDYNDSDWETSFSSKITSEKWNGLGWFRIKLGVDSSLWGKSASLLVTQLGASEVYLNGKHLYSFGVVSNDPEVYNPMQNRVWKTFQFDSCFTHVFAVRFANPETKYHNNLNIISGFVLYVRNTNAVLSVSYSSIRNLSIYQLIYTIVPFVLSLFHLLLYFFLPKSKQNLFYSICLMGFAGLSFFNHQAVISTNTWLIVFYYRLVPIFVSISLYFGLLTGYSGFKNKLPKKHILVGILAGAFGIWGAITLSIIPMYFLYVLIGIIGIEVMYIFFKYRRSFLFVDVL